VAPGAFAAATIGKAVQPGTGTGADTGIVARIGAVLSRIFKGDEQQPVATAPVAAQEN